MNLTKKHQLEIYLFYLFMSGAILTFLTMNLFFISLAVIITGIFGTILFGIELDPYYH